MYGNVGEKYIQIKKITLNGFVLNDIGSEFVIQDYYSVPHGLTSIKYNNVLLFIPDELFNTHFVTYVKYKKYYNLGDEIMMNVHGNLRTYSIKSISGDDNSHYVTMSIEAVD